MTELILYFHIYNIISLCFCILLLISVCPFPSFFTIRYVYWIKTDIHQHIYLQCVHLCTASTLHILSHSTPILMFCPGISSPSGLCKFFPLTTGEFLHCYCSPIRRLVLPFDRMGICLLIREESTWRTFHLNPARERR